MNEIFERVSIRNFTDQPVGADKVELLLRAAMQAPSADNQQPWEFVIVNKRSLLDELAQISPYSGPLKRAPLGIAVLAHTEGLHFPDDVMSDLGAATENILLEAVGLGLGAVWMGVMPIEERMANVKGVLKLPDNIRAYSLIAIGYPAESKKATSRYDEARIHHNGW